jgi:hypothetical protein
MPPNLVQKPQPAWFFRLEFGLEWIIKMPLINPRDRAEQLNQGFLTSTRATFYLFRRWFVQLPL